MALKTKALNAEEIRHDFPILSRTIKGKPLSWLDNAATTQKPRQVIEAYARYYEWYNANVHRAIHELGEEATTAYEAAREKLAHFVNARAAEEIVFVRGATEAVNLVARAWGDANIEAGDNIVLTVMEHHSNIVPWQLLAKRRKASLRYVDLEEDDSLRMRDYDRLIDERTRLVALTHVSNVLGTINSIRSIVKEARRVEATVLVDGAQSVPHMPVDVQNLDCDFLAISGHKMLAPTGIGGLYSKREILEAMEPFHGGGEMIKEVWLEGARWNDVPWKYEAGTPNIGGAIALGAAVDYLDRIGLQRAREHEQELTKVSLELFSEIPQVQVYGPKEPSQKGGIIAFNVDGVHPHDVAAVLDRSGVAIRSGHHCAMPLHTRLGLQATARASFYIYNTAEEVERLAEGVKEVIRVFGK